MAELIGRRSLLFSFSGQSEQKRTHLVHAAPCTTFLAVCHDAEVAGKGNHEAAREAMAVNCADDGNCSKGAKLAFTSDYDNVFVANLLGKVRRRASKGL